MAFVILFQQIELQGQKQYIIKNQPNISHNIYIYIYIWILIMFCYHFISPAIYILIKELMKVNNILLCNSVRQNGEKENI